jgi:hypothetical protein
MGIIRQLGRRIRGPRCHLDAEEKEWVERRMIWLKEQFGSEPIRRAPIDATSQLLPKNWDGSYEAGEDLFTRLCAGMLVDPARLHLEFYSQSETHEAGSAYAGESHSFGPAGLYCEPKQSQKLIIALEESALLQPGSLAATICHELAHVHLLADKRIQPEETDCEPLTDLLTVYFGAGILTANTAFQFSQWQDGRLQGWNASRQGYLSEAQFGFALACYSWIRGDTAAFAGEHFVLLRGLDALSFDNS